ncbi:response regulator transcription factor [Sphingomonas morindae]|uniref:LuxR C-terminal-related transcriptional regulator n=1 Tax=Sphingomonas morindae TaxID=1541170 RepID=A0ABY4X503_9SPHN|nr:LuxR C-terminal-related transcriptional regulator [Sphingomonas morindae]USI71978.1 LuxR C-terminal-related transcriptional regulator [Sphingomonas morindae]
MERGTECLVEPLRVHILDDDRHDADQVAALVAPLGGMPVLHHGIDAFVEAAMRDTMACLIVEQVLATGTGLAAQRELARRACRLPLILLSRRPTLGSALAAMRAGALDYLERPIDPALLAAAFAAARLHVRSVAGQSRSAARLALLTPREHDIFLRLAIGTSTKMIAHELGLASRTVEHGRARILRKLDVTSLAAATRLALEAGVID